MRNALQVLMFFPRGDPHRSARYLARDLRAAGWATRVVSGSLGGPGDPGNAAAFFGPDADLVAVPYDDAVTAPDPQLASPPMHPSFEDRPGAPDRVMASLDDRHAHHLADEWAAILGAPGVLDGVEVAHLHHLTPVHEALARVAPAAARWSTHLHGTELLMLDEADGGATWVHEAAWRERMRRWARASARVIVSSEPSRADAERLLGIDPARLVVVANGVDLRLFGGAAGGRRPSRGALPPLALRGAARLVAGRPAARGHRLHRRPSIAPLVEPDAVVLLFVSRFTAVKRAALLVRAHARAREALGRPLPLVFVGGAAGEWEGEHPADAAARSPWGREIFFAGWRSHDELAEVLACGDVLAVPSVAERFGQVYVEAMAMGLPVIACRAAAPPTYIDDDPASPDRCGWLVAPDDEAALAEALLAAASDPAERALRGANGRRRARERFSWERLAHAVADVYAEAAAG